MKPIVFKECNAIYECGKEEYIPLPSFYDDKKGVVVTCYRPSLRDAFKILFTRRIWVWTMTLGKPWQPQYITADKKDLFIKN